MWAEVSLAENAEAMRAGRHEGTFPTCWDGIELSIDVLYEKDIKVVVNGGGLNPGGLARKVQALVGSLLYPGFCVLMSAQVSRKGFGMKVACVSGDDLYDVVMDEFLKTGNLPPHLDSENEGVTLNALTRAFSDRDQKPIVSANAYLGARAIVKALEAGADMVICGRVADASPVIAAAWWWYGWQETDYDRLAGALIGGHLIECSGYMTGGNFSGFDRFDLNLLVDLPFGIVEIGHDGSCVVTIHETGKGVVDRDIVQCQFLYELQGAVYLNSDVKADATNVVIEDVGRNRVRVSGIVGRPPPPTTKLAIFYRGGYQCQLLLNATGYNTDRKWELLEKQVRFVLARNGVLDKFDVLEFQV